MLSPKQKQLTASVRAISKRIPTMSPKSNAARRPLYELARRGFDTRRFREYVVLSHARAARERQILGHVIQTREHAGSGSESRVVLQCQVLQETQLLHARHVDEFL